MHHVNFATVVKVPKQRLSADALRGVVESFVLREGTDYGHKEFSLDEKCAAVVRQIERGEVEIWFDPASGSADLRPTQPDGTKGGDFDG